ncbi:sensor histidine kinase [Nocardioides mesophilus]|uniref:histidine kinase n=1 Tax=Nocardioides mesophilus TaxID=433659 RepID=A0A7G9RBG3_9ACTN|nr:sensor histidine kinase [Nocardioides mesophilus]QNN52938.1 sensor histidine kinase [Nocardioides mesophilus]
MTSSAGSSLAAPAVAGARTWTRPPRLDVALATAFVAMTIAEAVLNGDVTSPVEHIGVAGVAMAAVAWRRIYPLTVALVAVCANLVVNPNHEFATLLSLVLLCYTVGVETLPPRNYAGLVILLVPFLGGMALQGMEPSDLGAALVFLVGPWSVGTAVRQRSAHAAEAIARADRLQRDRELEVARVAAEERTRIARELHDIVSHSISVVTIQTQAVRRRLGPDHAAEAADLAAVEATARGALAEMRRLFGVLRADGEAASLAPQPGLGELRRLVEQAGSGDLRVRLVVEGEPVALPPGIDLAAYRIAQEGLTNALRHSGASEATVRVRYGPASLGIEVDDDGAGLPAQGPGTGGHGLVGIRERVALYGGTVELTRGPAGGVRLVASLPVREGP